MKSYKISKNNSIILIIFVLLISLLINVYTSVMNSRYRSLIGKETYKSVEEIRNRNESVLTTLEQCLKSKSISNEELLGLYKNFTSISKEYNNLWLNYKDYGKEEIVSIAKKSKSYNETPNDVYFRIESILFEYLTIEMQNFNEKIELDGEILDKFFNIYYMSKEINDFYKDFNENNIKNLDNKENIYIKNNYWIDILKGINLTLEPYQSYEFKVQ